ncbi:MAG: hypothetical protein JO029_11290 [Candidatus Eremiobacteraeota bacterium]|nr:hypothetical protein [Candidatus Eremiobacteraeota bacterium]MBV8284950.1 hypothetical protein [Candidatus Eremiobacteraeota bacterium]MBV8434852.1 hypothetical protein [Candidatus Eremiobacteraeota bacterium]MBV8584539.1 hypothetical protein [Candidatus Eremiobacteraeota bacterium]
MIAAAVFAAVLTHADSQRDALMQRWTQASKARVPAGRIPSDANGAAPAPAVSLQALAARELSDGARYRRKNVAPQPPPNPPWWQRALAWLGERWNEFWRLVFGRVHVGSRTTAAIGDVVLAVAILAFIYGATRLLVGMGYRRSRAAASRAIEAAPDAAALYARACDAAAQGDYAHATRLLFRSTLTLLDLRGAVRDDASATVGDVRRSLRRSDASIVPSFDAVAAAFVAGTYAERPIGAQEWYRARDAYDGMAGDSAA